MTTNLLALLALCLAAPATIAAPGDAAVRSDVAVAPSSSPLPQAPTAVTLSRTQEGSVLAWSRPAGARSDEITGYVVIIDARPLLVAASTLRIVVPPAASSVRVASMNEAGCSLPVEPTAPRDARPVRIASRGAR